MPGPFFSIYNATGGEGEGGSRCLFRKARPLRRALPIPPKTKMNGVFFE